MTRVQPGADTGSTDPVMGPLPRAVVAALRALSDLYHPPDAAARGRIEAGLRGALADHNRAAPDPAGAPEQVAVAVRTACAHLHAGDLPDAYLALRTAHDTLAAHRRSR